MLQAIDQLNRRRRVLFVDDSRLMRYAGSRFLYGHCDIVLARDGREAWRTLAGDDQIDLVFTDLMMPVMDGHELIRRIRRSSDRRIRQLPVLVVTGDDESSARKQALEEGASDFIAKPFTPDDLRHALTSDNRPKAQSANPQLRGLPSGHEPRTSGAGPFQQPQEPATYCHRLQQTLSFHQRQQLELSLLHVQFQGHRQLDKRFGRHWADAVMRNIDRILVEELRDEDSVHRTAADLFSIILMGTGREGARILTRRLRQRLVNTHMRFSSMEVPIDVRFAVQFPDLHKEEDPEILLDEALRLVHWRTSPERVAHTEITDR
ncbi:GGDEF domain-containing response regulator [Wenzhouxiangella sp. EGI_FJ10305]|uniref:GGDEF domain-containing response regulator n=1 Tax=Wenzhouxiangella sp. EGI_FJ10305 TaxID=3243768 RepID=UPI0035D8B9E9